MTNADFFNIERSKAAGPTGGGGQSYISLSFAGITHKELGVFLGVVPPERIGTDRPKRTIDVGVLAEPDLSAPLEFAPRYQPPKADDRYRIARQNRQFQERHPAWTPERGFPSAPNDVESAYDPRMPDLTYLKVLIAALDTGAYLAGFVNTAIAPAPIANLAALAQLFQPYEEHNSCGIIQLEADALDVGVLADGLALAGWENPNEAVGPEVADVLEETRIGAGRPPRGQGRRQDLRERTAIEARAMHVAEEHFAADWHIEVVATYRSYDLHCTSGDNELRVEVKGTTGDGSSILLTPNEVDHAREHRGEVMTLAIVSGIEILDHAGDEPVVADHGDLRVIDSWDIDEDGVLRPTGYEYRITREG